MNISELSKRKDSFEESVFKHSLLIFLAVAINSVNGLLLFTFFKNPGLTQESRYVLYMQLIVNDMAMVTLSVMLHMFMYTLPGINVALCCLLMLIVTTIYKNTPLILGGMALERFVAVCFPLHHSQISTVYHTRLLLGIIWLVAALPCLVDFFVVLALQPLAFFASSRMCFIQNVYFSEYHRYSDSVVHIVYMCSVCVVLIFTYFRVLMTAKQAVSDQAQAQKARKTILLHWVQLLLCTLSLFTPALDRALLSLFPYYQSEILFINFTLTSILPRLLTPLIYGLRDQRFRSRIRSVLYSCTRREIVPTK